MLERQGYFPVTSPRHGKDHVRCLKQKKLPSRRFRTLLYCLFQILNPKFLVFHLPGADRVPRCYASRSHSVYLSVSQARAGKSPGSLALVSLQARPVPDILRSIFFVRYIPTSYLRRQAMKLTARQSRFR